MRHFPLKVRQYCIPNSSSFVSLTISYLISNRISSNLRTNTFSTPLLRVKNIIHNKKTIYIRYAIPRVGGLKLCNWIKTIITSKEFFRSPLGTLTSLSVL